MSTVFLLVAAAGLIMLIASNEPNLRPDLNIRVKATVTGVHMIVGGLAAALSTHLQNLPFYHDASSLSGAGALAILINWIVLVIVMYERNL